MHQEGDSIASSLFSELDEREEGVEELFRADDAVHVLEGIIESKPKAEPICPEDLAWIDSCLVAEPELSMESWISLKEALLDSITLFATSYEENNEYVVDDDEARNDKHMELCQEQKILHDQGDTTRVRATGIDDDEDGINEHMELGEKQDLVNDQGDTAHIRAKLNNTRGDHDSDDDGEAEFVAAKKKYESWESIFKVWELREEEDDELIPELQRAVADLRLADEEEDLFITELNRAVAESIIKERQKLQTDDASIADDKKLDELISSMGGLSIKPLP